LLTDAAMVIRRVAGSKSFVDAFERELDKGVVVDSWAGSRLLGIDLLTVEAHVQVRSLEIVATPRS
jgi:hypothetical protein